jgi:uncharacterized protein (DUF885 family)
MVHTTGMNESEVISEVERYMGMPGQACAYKVGQLKILELRRRAAAALGPKFDMKDFHAVVLENGGLPLTLLEAVVDAWIAKTRPEAGRGAQLASLPPAQQSSAPNRSFVRTGE